MSAIATIALAYLHNLIVVGIALLAGGFVWLATMSSLNVTTRRLVNDLEARINYCCGAWMD